MIMDFSGYFDICELGKSERTQRRQQQKFFNTISSSIRKSSYLKPNFLPIENNDESLSEKLQEPLYPGCRTTLLDSLFRHFINFSANNGMSKTALSMCLKNEKTVLPTPNCLPESYKDAYQLIKPMIIETRRYDACVNDCLLFCKTNDNDYSLDRECMKCGETRYKAESLSARKTFTYMPIGPRLSGIFGSDNICKILYSRQDLCNGKLTDIVDGKIYKSWYKDGGVFQNMEESCTVPLALFWDYFVTSGAALWCLRGLLPTKQETTLGKLFNVIELLTSESYHENELEYIIESTSEAVSLVERDFPIALQTITTHLLHHIPEGFANFGPLYGRWLFPFERVNSWITRQALNKNKIEATIMETYAIYDWCVYMIMSGKVKQDDIDIGKLERLLLEDEKDDSCSTNEKKFSIDDNILREMANIYDFCLISRMRKEGKELASCTRSYGNTTYGNTGRKIKFSPYSNNKSSNSYVYAVDQHSTDSFLDSMIFGSICKIFEHVWRGQTYTWVLLDIFDDVRYEDGFWSVLESKTSQKAVMLKDVSAPQIVGRDNDRLHYVSTCI
ncbi:uncharacterized protein LOC127717236 [Mytilus californianus]|uniref:uncharacterized protein LOC127717236 n=1 Tax=Mytilus californianus TaxID=6549 RepID=UPI0022475EB6|nr:uncharacterized protein LOC127717236 [Mytilus californianus]